MMEEMTMQFIYALKRNPHELSTLENIAIKAMSELTDTPEVLYKPCHISKIAQQMFIDYISTCDNPRFEVWQFFDCYNHSQDMTNALLATLQMTQVRGDEGYVNGFWKVEMNKMPEILEGYLIELNNMYTCSVWADEEGLVWDTDYTTSDSGVARYVEEVKNQITAIYRKQGKDYICVWERD